MYVADTTFLMGKLVFEKVQVFGLVIDVYAGNVCINKGFVQLSCVIVFRLWHTQDTPDSLYLKRQRANSSQHYKYLCSWAIPTNSNRFFEDKYFKFRGVFFYQLKVL